MHRVIDPAILYFGTPVVLISSLNEDGTPNLAPISSAWWLGRSCLLGFGARSKTPQNLLRQGECVINLPSVEQVAAVDRLARTTGSNPVPPHKQAMGYRYEADKFAVAGLTADPSELVAPPRVRECPVQLEATVERGHPLAADDPDRAGKLVGIEVTVRRIHIAPELVMEGTTDRVDPHKWRPLIMSFCQFFGLGGMIHPSRLAEIPESMYRPAPAAHANPVAVAAPTSHGERSRSPLAVLPLAGSRRRTSRGTPSESGSVAASGRRSRPGSADSTVVVALDGGR
jgi:flavin reductase (DIM6/NTAB) family NADH-FMN oxidoreductase RutF